MCDDRYITHRLGGGHRDVGGGGVWDRSGSRDKMGRVVSDWGGSRDRMGLAVVTRTGICGV